MLDVDVFAIWIPDLFHPYIGANSIQLVPETLWVEVGIAIGGCVGVFFDPFDFSRGASIGIAVSGMGPGVFSITWRLCERGQCCRPNLPLVEYSFFTSDRV